MKIGSTLVRFSALTAVLLMPLVGSAQELAAYSSSTSKFTANPDHIYLLEARGDQTGCRLATPSEAQALRRSSEALHVIYPAPGQIATASGLQITLRSTAQLEGFPAAKAAFVNAAKVWESRISNPMSVNIDVDFGPKRFGVDYPKPNILGSTNDASYFGTYATEIRPLIVARSDNAAEAARYNALPLTSVPTDLGPATKAGGSYIQLRALGADLPDDAPSIGFNSAFPFDLDPSNGIDAGKFDFEAVAVHEMGHALGFGSAVGMTELDPTAEVIPTIWDLFRFRPGVTTLTFTSAQRPMTSGGTHVSFVGGATLQMATGRPDGSGGDGDQPSHWKDNTGGNPLIGLMDPSLVSGTRGTLTDNDLAAFDLMGYTIGVTQTLAGPTNLTATATSTSVIRLTWTDNSNNETEFRVEQKNSSGAFIDIGSVTANSTSVNITGLNAGQTATFRVRARNASGDSPYTNEATATTLGGVPTTCTPNATTVCLLSDRFRVSIGFINQFATPPAPGNFLGAKLVAGVQNPDVATFGISSAQAIEVVVRIQDTRIFGLNRFDVYYGGLTDLEYTVTVTDTQTGTTRTYRNPPGTVGGGLDRTSFVAN